MLCPIRLMITLNIRTTPQSLFDDPRFFEFIRPERIRQELATDFAYPELLR
jgi:hypothetical protein